MKKISIKLIGIAVACLGLNSAQAASIQTEKIATPDGERAYLLARPDAPASGSRPLVIVLHGHGGNAANVLGQSGRPSPLAHWLAIADREKLQVAALDGAIGGDGRQGWNDCRRDAYDNPKTDDVAFVSAVAHRLIEQDNADPRRIYVMGMSNGGMMAYRLALELDIPVAAFAAVSASMAADSQCRDAAHPVSAMIVNGTADPIVPYQGGGIGLFRKNRGQVQPIDEVVAYWRRVDGLETAPGKRWTAPHREPDDPTRAEITLWGDDAHRPQVELVRIDQGGHIEPSLNKSYRRGYERLVGPQNHDLEATEAAWRFFEDKRAR